MHISRILLPMILGAASVCVTGAAHGQDPIVTNDFIVSNAADSAGVDRSYAAVTAERGDRRVVMLWACSGTDTRVVFGFPGDPYGEQLSMTWRFADEAPDSLTLARSGRTASGMGSYRLPDARVHAFTTRILGTRRFVLRVLDAGAPVDFDFFLDRADDTLNSLGCVRALRPPAAPAQP